MRRSPVTSALIAQYLAGPPYTVGTFLAYTLQGKAKKYTSRYLQRMIAVLNGDPNVVTVPSIRGGTAYRVRGDA